MKNEKEKIICQNKKAYHDYFIEEEYEAGLVLTGTEIKSIRLGKVNIQDSYCDIKNYEMYVVGMHISPYEKGNIFNHKLDADRKLLLHRKEIIKLGNKIQKEGYTIIPLRVVIREGIAKMDIGLAKGKKLYDKREDLKKSSDLAYIKKTTKEY